MVLDTPFILVEEVAVVLVVVVLEVQPLLVVTQWALEPLRPLIPAAVVEAELVIMLLHPHKVV